MGTAQYSSCGHLADMTDREKSLDSMFFCPYLDTLDDLKWL